MPHHVSRMLLSLRSACVSPRVRGSFKGAMHFATVRYESACASDRVTARRGNRRIPSLEETRRCVMHRSRKMWPVKYRRFDRTSTIRVRNVNLSVSERKANYVVRKANYGMI